MTTTMIESGATRAYNRLSPAVWAEICALWETGEADSRRTLFAIFDNDAGASITFP